MTQHGLEPKLALGFLAQNDLLTHEFKSNIGGLAEFDSSNAKYPNILKNLGNFDVYDLVDGYELRHDDSDFWAGNVYGTLVEHVRTGGIYALIPGEGALNVYSYNKTTDWPTEIATDIDDDWVETAVDSPVTRYGGVTDFSIDAWPHYRGCPLYFAARYVLPDGKVINAFIDTDSDGSWRLEGGANCAIVDGGPVPSWITLESLRDVDEDAIGNTDYYSFYMLNPTKAFYPQVLEIVTPEPRWVQEEEEFDEPGYKFLLQFGHSTIAGKVRLDADLWELSLGDSGDMYLFYKEETKEARVSYQCS